MTDTAPDLTILGLPTCDTCRKARKALPAAGFRDVRADPLSAAEIAELEAVFGDKIVNRASTTWRGLGDDERSASTLTLLQAHPALMKRPVIRAGDALYLGWSPAVHAALGVD